MELPVREIPPYKSAPERFRSLTAFLFAFPVTTLLGILLAAKDLVEDETGAQLTVVKVG